MNHHLLEGHVAALTSMEVVCQCYEAALLVLPKDPYCPGTRLLLGICDQVLQNSNEDQQDS